MRTSPAMLTATNRVLAIPLLVIALLALMALDRPTYLLCRDLDLPGWIEDGWDAWLLKLPGDYRFTIVCAALLAAFHPQRWRAAGFVLLTGLPALLNAVVKWVAGRSRPGKWGDAWEWDPFRNGWPGLWKPDNLSLFSGHAVLAFGWAEAMSIGLPRWRWAFYSAAVVTGLQRVAATNHYLTDVVGGAVVGVVTVRVMFRILSAIVPPAPVQEASADGVDAVNPDRSRAELASMSEMTGPYLSLVIPCYNEEENVPTLLQRVEAALNTIGKPYEVIIVDDGSTDSTPRLLAEAKATRPWLRVLRMQKNAGQSAGFEAGFNAARGQYIATIDADLQNDPEEVPRLLEMIEAHPEYDMINGWRKDRQDTGFRRWQSRQANRIRNWISQDNINDSACSLKVYRAHAIKGLKLFNGAHRFFPALVKMRGYTVFETPVKHSQRFAGTAKYGFRNRAFRAFIDLLGVRWMKMRYLQYVAEETGPGEAGPKQQETGAGA